MTTSLPTIPNGTLQRLWWWLVQVPWRGLGLYSPQALLALPAAYASSQFAAHHNVFPFPFNMMLGVAFEWTYLGTLAVAGAHTDSTWYKVVNGMAVAASVIYVTLHAAERYGLLASLNTPGWLWLFAVVHGLPIAGLNFVYGLLVHQHLKAVAVHQSMTAHKCPWCGRGFRNHDAVNGHMRSCPMKPEK